MQTQNDQNQNNRPKKKIWADGLKIAMPIIVPIVVKKLVAMIPAGTKVDTFFSNYKEQWLKVAPIATGLILQLTNMPDFADDMVAELGAEVARVIKEKYSDGNDFKEDSGAAKEKTPVYTLTNAMVLADKDQLLAFSILLNSISEEQRKRVLSFNASNKDDAKNLLVILAGYSETEFKIWAEVIAPTKAPHVDTEFEKNVKESLNSFKDDANSFFEKKTWLQKQAEKHRS